MPDYNLLDTYDYVLPNELIAQYPLKERSASRLLRLNRSNGSIQHRNFKDLIHFLRSGDVLVLNTSKVLPARLFAKKENGTQIEVFLLHSTTGSRWQCIVNPGKRLKKPQTLYFSDKLQGWIENQDAEGIREIEFNLESDLMDEIFQIGHVPLPPYICRDDQSSDHNTYQTVYASHIGSVASPTAGLHFTPEMLHEIQNMGVNIAKVILHVGLGTFKPVKVQKISDHVMHSEFCTIDENTARMINSAKKEKRRIIAVGTTSVRTLESFFDKGSSTLSHGNKWTDIFIHPGKSFEVVDAMITNFHLPKSTLLMLVSAFAGHSNTMNAYREAIQNRYRFFSYGDAMFISD